MEIAVWWLDQIFWDSWKSQWGQETIADIMMLGSLEIVHTSKAA